MSQQCEDLGRLHRLPFSFLYLAKELFVLIACHLFLCKSFCFAFVNRFYPFPTVKFVVFKKLSVFLLVKRHSLATRVAE